MNQWHHVLVLQEIVLYLELASPFYLPGRKGRTLVFEEWKL